MHLWRAQTLRYLDPLASQLGKELAEGQKASIVVQARHKLAETFVEEFLAGPPGELVPIRDESMMKQLFLIVNQACEIAYRLWTQKTAIEVLNREGAQRTSYSKEIDELELHIYHTRDIEENEQALEGKPIILFVHPIVLARGTYEGTDYDQAYVWKRGMVWLG